MPLNKKSHKIIVPEVIYKSSKEVIRSFLSGLYKGDGYISNQKIEYGTRSKKLAQGICYLLTFFGIKSKFWRRKDGMYLVTISGKLEINKFKENILEKRITENIRRYYNAQYKLPKISDLLRKAKNILNLHYGKQIPEGIFESVISGRTECGLIRLQRIMEYVEKFATPEFRASDLFKSLKILASGTLLWNRIVKIRKSEPQIMYDLETENSSFIGGELPLLLHNSKWFGESEQRIRELFRRAKQVSPSIILFDEIDALAPRRGFGRHEASERIVSQLLTEMSGIEEMKGVVVIATTNRPDLIDPALLRPGRIDRFVLVPAPDEKSRLEILKVHTRNMPLKNVDLKEWAKKTEGFSGADLEALCREAAMDALRENIKAKEITNKHFEQAFSKIKPSITKDVISHYQKFVERSKKITEEEKETPGYIG
jgi:hypothetical protein